MIVARPASLSSARFSMPPWRVLVAAILLSMSASTLSGASWYLDGNAATNGTGSQASPWKAVSNIVWASIAPGDTLFIRGFDYRPQVLDISNRDGTPGNPITVKYDPSSTGKAIFASGVLFDVDHFVLDGFVASAATDVTKRVTGGNQQIAFYASGSAMPKHIFSVEGGSSFTTIRGIEVTKTDFNPAAPGETGGDTTGQRHGISFSYNNDTNMHDNIIERCYVHHVSGDGINLNCIPDPAERYDNFIVRYNHVFHVGDDGLQGLAQDITVFGNYFDNDLQEPLHGGHPDGYQPGTGARNTIVANNVFRGFNQNIFLEFCAGDNYIFNNVMIGIRTSGTDCGISLDISYNPGDWRSQGIRSPNNPSGVVVEVTRLPRFKGSLVITNNTFYNFNSGNAMNANSDIPGIIAAEGDPAATTKEFIIGNNLFINNRFVATNEFQGNLDSTNHYFNLPGAQFFNSSGTPVSPSTFVSGSALLRNPALINPGTDPATHNFDLGTTSAAIDAGTSRSSVSALRAFLSANGFDADAAGRSRPQGNRWDVGAFELLQTTPQFVTQPSSQIIAQGNPVTFTTVTRGQAGYTLQWKKDDVAIPGATNEAFSIGAVAPGDAGAYKLTITTTSFGSLDSDVATLQVNLPPSFSAHPSPASQTVLSGSNVTYSVTVAGVPTPTLQWQKNGVNISGQTNSSLTLSGVTTASNGVYRVVATNIAGGATSNEATLAIAVAPAFSLEPSPASQTVAPGVNVTYTATASGVPAPTFQWRKSGTNIPGATNASLSLSGVTTADNGTYSVVATNMAGGVTSVGAALTVAVPASFTASPTPASQTVVAGTNITYTVSATGTPTPTFQWRKNGTNIPGATTTTLSLPNVTTADNGSYTAVATNIAGDVVSSAASLTVAELPVFTTQPGPASQTVAPGSNVTYTSAASGVPAPGYQWRRNGTNIAGATGATLSLTAVTTAVAGDYTVVASNLAGNVTSSVATLVVTDPPAFSTHPATQSVAGGANVTFLSVATGVPTPTFQWRRNGTNIVGATNQNLVLPAVTTANAGIYTVVATNSSGTATSTPAILSVDGVTPPAITTQPATQSVSSGATVTFTVAATGTPSPTFQWQKDGVAIGGATSSSLVLVGVSTGNAGAYNVIVSNSAASVTSDSATLTVAAPPAPQPPPPVPILPLPPAVVVAPVIVSHPQSQAIVAPAGVSFSVEATGGALTFQWLKNGAEIAGANAASYQLPSTTAADAGNYSVRVANAAGSVTSNSATLTVEAAPTINTQPSGQTVVAGSSVTFSVGASGNPAPSYQWRKNGSNLTGQTGASLTLAAATVDDAGTYSVVVSNSRGSVTSSNAELLVNRVTVAGSYFGSFPDGGTWALVVRPDNTATYLAYLPGSSTAIATDLTIAPDGSFSVSGSTLAAGSNPVSQGGGQVPSVAAAPVPFTLNGRIANSRVTGQVLNQTIEGQADTGANASAGYYRAPALLTGSGTTHSIVGPSGRALVVTATPTFVDGATGTLDSSNGLTATTGSGAQIAVALSAGQTIAVSYVSGPTAPPMTFGGLNGAVPSTSALANLSIRSLAGTGPQSLIVGFAVSGASKPILVRGIGPGLAAFNVTGTLPDPRLELSQSGSTTPVSSNDNWEPGAAAAFSQVGAFALPNGSRDAAIVVTLAANAYTAQLSDVGGGTGVALLELYDTAAQNGAKLVNVSARTQVGTGGAILIAGFNVSGAGPRSLLIRGIGPALGAFGITDALGDPRLDLYAGGATTPIASNDNWTTASSARFAEVGAFNLTSGSRDSALVVTLNPGSYTVQLSGVSGATGIALVELYELP